MDLGTEPKDNMPPMAGAQSEAPKTVYPSFSVRDAKVEELCKECEVGKDDEGTATIRWRVSGHRDDEYGKSIDFQVLELNDIAKAGGEKGEEEESEDEKKSSPNPAVRKLMKGMKR